MVMYIHTWLGLGPFFYKASLVSSLSLIVIRNGIKALKYSVEVCIMHPASTGLYN